MIVLRYLWLLIALALTLWAIGSYLHWVHQRWEAERARRHRAQASATAAALRIEVEHRFCTPLGAWSDYHGGE